MRSVLVACCALIALGGSANVALASPAGGPEGGEAFRGKRCMPPKRVERAERYADRRSGRVSFAFEDECRRLVGEPPLPAALLGLGRQVDAAGRLRAPGERRRPEADQLRAAYPRADDQAIRQRGGSQITAGDQAAFFQRVEKFVPRRHEDYVFKLTSRIVSSQSWSIPQAAPRGWKVSFKGGWYPAGDGWRVNQVATLRRDGRRISLAVLTDGGPSFGYGQETIRKVARILLEGYRR